MIKIADVVGNGNEFCSQAATAQSTLVPLQLKTSSAPAATASSTSRRLKLSIETAATVAPQNPRDLAGPIPFFAGDAAQIDDVGPVARSAVAMRDDLLSPRGAARD